MPGYPWKEEELEIILKYGKEKTTSELQELLPHRGLQGISRKKTALGIKLCSGVRGRLAAKNFVYGVGVNDLADDPNWISKKYDSSTKKIIWRCPFYKKWNSILRRCYNEKEFHKWPQYKDCTISDEWKIFSNFKNWMENQNWEGKHIDKDILVPNNKIYGKETCLFVSQRINNLLHIGPPNRRGDCPIGVAQLRNKYQAKVSVGDKEKYLGIFDTPEEAHEVYCVEKRKYIKEIIENLNESDTSDVERTKEALLRHLELGTFLI